MRDWVENVEVDLCPIGLENLVELVEKIKPDIIVCTFNLTAYHFTMFVLSDA